MKIEKLLNNKTYGQNNYLTKNKSLNQIINIKIIQYFLLVIKIQVYLMIKNQNYQMIRKWNQLKQ
jgi:hypothetical protein